MQDRLQESADIAMLLDFYGELLTDRQRTVLELHFGEDLSLSEIAGQEGITRQGARDAIVRGEAILRSTEEKLGLVGRFGDEKEKIASRVRGLEELRDGVRSPADAEPLIDLAKSLL